MQQVLRFMVILFLAFNCYACRKPAAERVSTCDTMFYIMAGQSNMAGRGAVEAIDEIINPRLLEMDDAARYSYKREPNTIYQGGLAGLDCGLSFGNELLLHLPDDSKLGLVQCSVSSTGIQEWLGDSLHVVYLYSNMLNRARAASRSGSIKGVLWMQGETDADNAQKAKSYGSNLIAFIEDFRRDIGIRHLPFFLGLLPAWCKEPYKDAINAGIRNAVATLTNVHAIETEGLTMRGDSLHFDAAGQRALGERFAREAMREL